MSYDQLTFQLDLLAILPRLEHEESLEPCLGYCGRLKTLLVLFMTSCSQALYIKTLKLFPKRGRVYSLST